MRIATWNVNGLRARLDYVRLWLRERQPDIVGLQELKLTDDQFPLLDFEAEGYSCLTYGQKAWNGVAILSREPMTVVRRGLPGEEAFGSRLITAQSNDLSFTTIYCPNGKHVGHDDFPRKLAWYERLLDLLQSEFDSSRSAVLCGDFNICPNGIDSWNEEGLQGEIFHTDEERERLANLLAWGFQDLFRCRYPDTRAYSWWDYRAGAFPRNRGLRIDFLLGTKPIAERLLQVEIDREYRKKQQSLKASDHAPVFADLR